MKAVEIMTTGVVTVQPEASVREAAPRLFQAVDITVGISGSPGMALQLLSRVWHSQWPCPE
jgi:hypothetical protein